MKEERGGEIVKERSGGTSKEERNEWGLEIKVGRRRGRREKKGEREKG